MTDTKLSVNLNKIALIRNSREANYPDLITFARMALDAGAHGVTVHPRSDGRHVRPGDLFEIREMLKDYPDKEFNIEGSPDAAVYEAKTFGFAGFLDLVKEICPHQCTLVPDSPDQLTSDHGWDFGLEAGYLKGIVEGLQDKGIRVSLFVDAGAPGNSRMKETGTDRVEIYTGPYAEYYHTDKKTTELNKIRQTLEQALAAGIEINAGHDLNLQNLPELMALGKISEVSIGHALTVDALTHGFKETIKKYLKTL